MIVSFIPIAKNPLYWYSAYMKIIIKTKEELDAIREGGKILAHVVQYVIDNTKVGMTTNELDVLAEAEILKHGAVPAFKGYTPEGVSKPYPKTLCVSINEQIVHGIPGERIIKEGDVVSIDCGVLWKSTYTDHARTIIVGKSTKDVRDLVNITAEALEVGIMQALPGNTVGDIGCAIEKFVNKRTGIVRELVGHGVGRYIHEDPFIPNYGRRGRGIMLVPGMVIAIEPQLTLGTEDIIFQNDEYTVITQDKKPAAHFEHTVIITEKGNEVVTRI